MAWSSEATFFALAAAVQLGIGLAIVVRRTRVEWALVLAAIFALNGALAINSLLVATIPSWAAGEVDNRVFFDLDRTVTVLILYLALAYPRRPRWARRPWILPLLIGGILASVFLLWNAGLAYHTPLTPEPANCPSPCADATPAMYWVYHGANVGFLVLLVRWAYLLPRMASPVETAHMRLLFAAFAVRALHVELQFYGAGPVLLLFSDDPLLGVDEQRWLLYLRSAITFAAVVAATAFLLVGRQSATTDNRRAIDFVLAFVLVGAVEAIAFGSVDLLGLAGRRSDYYFGVVQNLDVLVLRPMLVVYATLRYDLLGPWTRDRRVVLLTMATLAALGYAGGIYSGLADATGSGWLGALITAPLATGLGLLTALLVQAALGPGRTDGAQRYIALLEDLYRNGEPSPAQLKALDRDRQRLGVEPGEAEALRAAVAGRWRGEGLWLPGQRIAGRYLLQRLLGSGGWGEVYLADDVLDGRPVVLKRTKALSSVERKALLAEGYVLTKLSHPNLVPLVRTEVVDGEPILVLEHMAGGSLATRLQGGRLSRADTLRVADGLLAALAAVHAANIVHGDVKPGNILYAADGHVRLGDFGLARSRAPAPALGDPTPSPRSLGTGSVRYLAPEQARGQPATPASDVYAAGIVLLECLTGRHPIDPAKPEYEQRRSVAEDPVDVPASLGPWRGLVARMLERDAERRPTAERLRENLPRAAADLREPNGRA